MKRSLLIHQPIQVFSISELFLLYGLNAIIGYTVFLILYEQVSSAPSAPLPPLTVTETAIALEHLWTGFLLFLASALILHRTEKRE